MPRSRVLIEKLAVVRLVINLVVLYRTQSLVKDFVET
jgi:hypothetical protein